ncbi:hypothetical protein [Streptomyces sp. NPDC018045]|uniref:hypothetical protein n=1 Tax=Streptomyces sp. NPDC018045 TaxID=3365037 RepID=UPI0037A67D48
MEPANPDCPPTLLAVIDTLPSCFKAEALTELLAAEHPQPYGQTFERWWGLAKALMTDEQAANFGNEPDETSIDHAEVLARNPKLKAEWEAAVAQRAAMTPEEREAATRELENQDQQDAERSDCVIEVLERWAAHEKRWRQHVKADRERHPRSKAFR